MFVAAVFSSAIANAQVGYISTYAEVSACNIALDNYGNLYTASGGHIYKIDSGGTETSVAGGGTSYGEGGPATAAQISNAYNLAFDASGNMYIADNGYGVVRKVNTSGIITTVAGNHSLGIGYTGDGGAATAAEIDVTNVCVDVSGNIYIADMDHYVIRKVSTSGIIATVAGNGTAGTTGDGGPATAAELDNYTEANIWGIATDLTGNLYISEGHNYRVRRVNSAGIITTIAGDGHTGDTVGRPATASNVYYPEGLTVDGAGNLYIAEWQNCVLSVMNTSGILNTVAGNYSISFSGDGGPATAAGLNAVSDVAIDASGNIYIADCHNSRIRKVAGSYVTSTYVADSFGISMNELCSGPQLLISTRSYNPAYSVKTYYGDGHTDSSGLTAAYAGSGVASFSHAYSLPGTYSVKTVLLNSGIIFDSLSYSFEFKLCNTLSTQYYYDANSDCIFDGGDSHISLPMLTEVDSNGIAIDTISSTSGIYYTAYGNPGDIYAFKLIGYPGSLHATCPSSGVVTDTLRSSVYNFTLQSIALRCDTSSNYDLSVNAVVPVTGVHDQWGNVYVSNTHCAPEDATVTVHYSRHYMVDGGFIDVHPAPSSYTDSTITWNVAGLHASESAPVDLYYAIWVNPDSGLVVGYPAQTYYTIYPIAEDVDTSNNFQIKIDTVRGGCDPNEMSVAPSGIIPAGTQLQYTINFTNTGTDTTYNVYVMDTLSDNVDVSSFRLVMSAANMNILKYSSGGHNILKFDFPAINLLDSTDHPQNCSSGLSFNINAKAGLPDGSTIFNHAGVFFDYNPVVTTNTVEDIIGGGSYSLGASALKPVSLNMYPNPAQSILHLDNIQAATSYTVTDIIGAVMLQGNLAVGYNSINIANLSDGMYFINVNGVSVRKFVKR